LIATTFEFAAVALLIASTPAARVTEAAMPMRGHAVVFHK
jgi:hypothetical protein